MASPHAAQEGGLPAVPALAASDFEWDAEQAMAVLQRTATAGELALIKGRAGGLAWRPFLEDAARRSFSYVLRGEDNAIDAGTLREWFEALHPRRFAWVGDATWTGSQHEGEGLLRQTAWCTFTPSCACEYGYSDTWQPIASDSTFTALLAKIARAIEGACGLPQDTFNAVNLNFYPRVGGVGFHSDDKFLFDGLQGDVSIASLSLLRGGGVGFHADDEFLFDGLQRDVSIVSLSLCEEGEGLGVRRFQVRRKESSDKVWELDLRHGDLMTMEGLFQLFYLHAVWPGDSKEYDGHPLAQGERINLTFRTIVRHLDGSQECRGLTCPVSKQ